MLPKVLILFFLFGAISSERIDVTGLFKKLDEFAHQSFDSTNQFTRQTQIPSNLPYVETFICAMEPSKLDKCKKDQSQANGETNFMIEKFKELKNILVDKINRDKSSKANSNSTDVIEASERVGNFQMLRLIECPDSYSIKILNAFMTNKNKYICPPPVESIDSASVCNSTSETMQIVKNLCENQQKCTIKIDEQFKDICTCIDQHYLNLTYVCMPSSQAISKGAQEYKVKESTITKRNTLRRGGRNFRLNFVDPFYDFYPQFYTGPMGILGFDIRELGMHSAVNEPFPFNYDFFPGNWHGWGGWGNLLQFPHAHDYDTGRPGKYRPGKSNGNGYGRGGYSNSGYGGGGAEKPMPFNRGGAGSFKKHGKPIKAGNGGRRSNTKFNLVGQS